MKQKGITVLQMKENFKKYNAKVHFMGIGVTIIKHEVDDELLGRMQKVALRLSTPLELALFDAEFFDILNYKPWDCLYDLKTGFCTGGLIDGYRNSIEVWVNGKRKRTIKHFDLWNEYNLFPLYNLKITESQFKILGGVKYITIVETSMGKIKSFRINTNNFDLDKLTIHLNRTEISSGNIQPIITLVKYNNRVPAKLPNNNLIINRIAIIE